MPMTVAVTRNVPGRYAGFLASCMLPVAPGVYVSPHMRKGVRERLWRVMLQWAGLLPGDAGIMLLWRDSEAPSGLSMRTVGWPKKEILDHEGVWLAVEDLTARHDPDELADLADPEGED
ncbi:MAG: type I-E CRISPR-associated endoribonuclease Cas2e [Planctomycetota bacterium]